MLLSITKNEIIYSIYISSFEQIKKNADKKDQKLTIISEICNTLNNSNNILNDLNQLEKFSLILVQPLDICTSKIIDIILKAYEQIIKDDLINKSIIQKMAELLLIYIKKYLDNNDSNLKINQKILNVCELIYSNNFIFIHNKNFNNILEICAKIYLSEKENNKVNKLFNFFIDKIFSNMSNNKISVYTNNQYNFNLHDYKQNKNNIDKKEFKKQAQLNSFLFYSKKYIDFLIDIIEIQSSISNEEKNNNIIDKYLNIIKEIKESSSIEAKNNFSFKEELELLNLEKLNIYYNNIENEKNKNSNKIGKYGWCFLCKGTSNYWSEKLNFPFCGKNSCEKDFIDFLSNLYSKNDYINMLLFLSKSSISNSNNDNQKNKQSYLRLTELCLETIKSMLNKGITFFKNDSDIIMIIKEILKESILKNALSQNIKIVKLSLDIFNIIFKYYRSHLKDNIEIFFMKVFINILESEKKGFNFKEIILDNLSLLLDESNFLIELYLNYDCDSNCTAVFCVLINLLTKIMNGLYQKIKYQNTFKNPEENTIIMNKTLNFFNKFIWDLNELIEKNLTNEKIKTNFDIEQNHNKINENNINDNILKVEKNMNEKDNIDGNKIKNIIDKEIEIFNEGKPFDECVKYLQNEKILFDENSFNKIKKIYAEDYNNNTIKEDYSTFFTQEENKIINDIKKYYISILNDKKKKSDIDLEEFLTSKNNNLIFFLSNIKKEKLAEINYMSYICFELAYFIRLNLKFLSIEKLRNFLFLENPFNNKVLYYYIYSFNFKDKNIFDSIKFLFSKLPKIFDENILDKIIQIFGEKFFDQNPNEIGDIDFCYYISFSLIELNYKLHQNQIKPNITLEKFIEKINLVNYGNHKIDEKYLENLYNQILSEPIIFLKNENKYELNSTLNYNDKNNYIIKKENKYIKKLVEFCWNNFLSIYSQLINESINKNKKDLFLICIQKILTLAKICGMLQIDIAQEAYINIILSMINLKEKGEVNEIMIEVIIKLMNYINDNCQYIRIGWMHILQLISKLGYYLLESEEIITLNMKNAKPTKFTDKEIKMFLNKKSFLSLNISDAVCESIFSKTELLDEESIVNFVSDLCEISKQEINSYFTPRLFSLNKLIEVLDFNIIRVHFQYIKIWKIVSNYLIEIIISSPHENIWKKALDSLKQTMCQLLSKNWNLIYNFQMEYFKPFELIFNKICKIYDKAEMLINSINFLASQYRKNISSGWIIIFKLLKNTFLTSNPKFFENIKNILKMIYEDTNILINNNKEIFRGYIECLCFIYTDKTMKQFAFEIIVDILSKLIKIEENTENEKNNDNNDKIVIKLPNSNKIYDFIRIFFYNIDEIMKINAAEYFNLLYEIINHNKKLLLSEDLNIFIYMYYSYFKPHISIILLSKYENIFSLLDCQELEKNEKILYNELTNNNIVENIRSYLKQALDYLINDFNKNESIEYSEIFDVNNKIDESKKRVNGFLKEIREQYNNDTITKYFRNKINEFSNLDESNYELSIKYFFEKFNNIYIKNKEKNNFPQYIKYNYFYIDLILSVQQLSILNNKSDLIYRTLFKIISSYTNEIKDSKKLISDNIYILKIISFSKLTLKNEEDIYKFIKYSLDYSNYLLDFIQVFQNELSEVYKLISKLFNRILLIDLDNKFEKYKIVYSNSSIVLLMKLQDIELFILNKIDINNYKDIKTKDNINSIINLNKIFDKYQIGKDENSLINKIFLFEIENIIPKFINILENEEIEIIYECITNLICSVNHNIRKAVKNLLKLLMKKNLKKLKNKHVN